MNLALSAEKSKLRLAAYAARDAQPEKDDVSRAICRRFIEQPVFEQAQTVLLYLSCRSEVKTDEAVAAAFRAKKNVVIPYCAKDELGRNKLGLWKLDDLSELEAGTWGLLEPPIARRGEPGKEISPRNLDLLMVPGVGFDRRGGRLGNGAGYFDYLLSTVRDDAVLSAVCYESQLFEVIPMDRHDVFMDYVITENQIFRGKGRK
ncbi:MAG: 5-formyltetrahydrofolate cyclo-ligase [Gammaproteobacteria bacterium]